MRELIILSVIVVFLLCGCHYENVSGKVIGKSITQGGFSELPNYNIAFTTKYGSQTRDVRPDQYYSIEVGDSIWYNTEWLTGIGGKK